MIIREHLKWVGTVECVYVNVRSIWHFATSGR